MNFDPRFSGRKFTSVGTRPIRPDGVDKVTGRARYGADFNMAGQLVGRVLRSPHAHAIIRKIDTSKAEKLSGVKAVITAKDLPDLTDGDAGMYDILDNCMARSKALYDGHAVAAVAAVDARTARQALKLIEMEVDAILAARDLARIGAATDDRGDGHGVATRAGGGRDDRGVADAEVGVGGEALIDRDRAELKCEEQSNHGRKLTTEGASRGREWRAKGRLSIFTVHADFSSHRHRSGNR